MRYFIYFKKFYRMLRRIVIMFRLHRILEILLTNIKKCPIQSILKRFFNKTWIKNFILITFPIILTYVDILHCILFRLNKTINSRVNTNGSAVMHVDERFLATCAIDWSFFAPLFFTCTTSVSPKTSDARDRKGKL